jgi:plasmid stabilization system protein ParE
MVKVVVFFIFLFYFLHVLQFLHEQQNPEATDQVKSSLKNHFDTYLVHKHGGHMRG